jgi:hypothetical protein
VALKIINYASPVIIKYDANGQLIWSRLAVNTNSLKNIALASKLDDSGNLYVICNSEILKYDSGGKLMWEVPLKTSFVATASAFGSMENMYIFGYDNAVSDKKPGSFPGIRQQRQTDLDQALRKISHEVCSFIYYTRWRE